MLNTMTSSVLKGLMAILIIALFFGMAQSCEEQESTPIQQAFDFNIGNPAEPGSRYPSIVTDAAGHLGMSWTMAVGEDLHAVQVAMMSPDGWTSPSTAIVSPDLFVNWADYPTMAIWEGEPVAVHWLKKRPSDNPYAYDIQVAFFEGGDPARWSDPITPHKDNTDTEHGFVSMKALSQDEVLLVWLDGREMAEREEHVGKDGLYAYHDEHGTGSMTLRSAILHRNGTIKYEQEIDHMVCECCPTDMVKTKEGFMVIYRNRTSEEIRDTWVSFYSLSTHRWSTPEPVSEDGWIIGGCPVNGPAAATSDEQIGVAWYTEANSARKLFFTLKTEDGFEDPIVLGEGRDLVGRVSLTANDNGTFYATWLEYLPLTEDESRKLGMVKLAVIDTPVKSDDVQNGAIKGRSAEGGNPQMEITKRLDLGIVENRRSGFPEVRYTNGELFVAWTQTDPRPLLKTLQIPISDL